MEDGDACTTKLDPQSQEKLTMAYYSVLTVTPIAEDWIADYIGSASALVAQHGGQYLAVPWWDRADEVEILFE